VPDIVLAMVLLLGLSLFGAKSSFASEVECPKTVAFNANDGVSAATTKILESLYRELDCQTEFVGLPARRGIRNFNHGLVDGEVFRLRQVESLYDRPFVRSSLPLFMLSNSLWLNPTMTDDKRRPIGYVLGVVWQENYMKTHEGKIFHGSDQVLQAYNDGRVRGMLFADLTMEVVIRNKTLNPPPKKDTILLEAPLYHYLGKEFTPFMAQLSDLLKSQPFKNIGATIQ